MFAIEFQAIVKDGVIKIPEEYRDNFKDGVRVLLLTEEPLQRVSKLIDELLGTPIQLEAFQPFARDEIYARY